MVAKDLFNLTLPDDIKLFPSHSIRVGACVLLHSSWKDGDFIKLRLRWKSDTFRLYLMNITLLAVQHCQAVENPGIPDLSAPGDLTQGLQSQSCGWGREERQLS
eukprot:15364722-Ditylum_brightwellii.AAC.1